MVYDPDKLVVIWNGRVIGGYAEGSNIIVDRNEDDVAPKTGLKGDTVYALNGNRSGYVELTLFNTSASLAQLRKDAQDRVEAPLTVRNANSDGGFIVSHTECRIIKVPQFSGGKEAQGATVRFYVPELNFAA